MIEEPCSGCHRVYCNCPPEPEDPDNELCQKCKDHPCQCIHDEALEELEYVYPVFPASMPFDTEQEFPF